MVPGDGADARTGDLDEVEMLVGTAWLRGEGWLMGEVDGWGIGTAGDGGTEA